MEKENDRMRMWDRIFAIPAVLLLVVFLATNLLAGQEDASKPSSKLQSPKSETCPQLRLGIQNQNMSPTSIGDSQLKKSEIIQKTKKLQIPFIANNGQTDERVKFYSNTFGSGSNVGISKFDSRLSDSANSSTQFFVVEHLMTYFSDEDFKGEYSSGKTPPKKTTFLNTDTCVSQWFSYQKATVGDTAKWEWYAPDGALYLTWSDTYSYVNGWFYSYIYINGYSASSKLGQWQVKVYRNDSLLFTENFTIQKDTSSPTPTPASTPTPTTEVYKDGSISILSIDPPEGTVLTIGKTYTFTVTANYDFKTATPKKVGVLAYDPKTSENLDDQTQNSVSVTSQTGEATVSVTTKISLNGNPVDNVSVDVVLFPKGFSRSSVDDTVKYTTTSTSTTTPTPTATSTPTPTPSPSPTTTPTASATPTTTPESEDLLEKYAPILYMHSDERFYPTKVEVMLNYSKLYETKKGIGMPVKLKGKNLSLDLLMNTKYNKNKYYLKLIKYWDDNRDTNYWKSFPTVYGREFRVEENTVNEKIILQYWFFYIYNDWDNKHEGDWEMIQIHLSKEKQPESIVYGYHHSGESFNWTDGEDGEDGEFKKNGNHPIVYVTLGGHGCWAKADGNIWYQKIKQLGECAECMDETDKGDVLYPNGFPEDEIQTSYSKYSYTLVNMTKWTDKKKDWIYWKGYWGNQQFAKELTKFSDFGISGPPSPPYIDYIDDDEIAGRWDKPLEWKNDSLPSNYKICTPVNTKVVVRDLENNTESQIVEWFSERCSKVDNDANIIYTGKDILLDVYSLDGKEVNLKISRYKRTGEVYDVEFDGLEIPRKGKASFTFSPEQNPTLEIGIDRDRDGIFDSHRLPDFLEVK